MHLHSDASVASPALQLLQAASAFERALARLEAAIDASPDLEAAWYMRATLSEACRSTTMENFVTSETHLVLGLAAMGEPAEDAAGDLLAARLWRLYASLPAPNQLFSAESVALLRLRAKHQVIMLPERAVVVEDGEGPPPALLSALEARMKRLAELPATIALPFAIAAWSRTISLGASHNIACRGAVPVLGQYLGVSRRPVVLPALGFTAPRFMPWAPAPTTTWAAQFLRLVAGGLAREADRFAELRRLQRRLDLALAPGGLGRNRTPLKRKLSQLVLQEPFLTGALIARKAGCSAASARQWLAALESQGLITPLPLSRSAARILVALPLDPPVRRRPSIPVDRPAVPEKRRPLTPSRLDLPPADLARLDREFAAITAAAQSVVGRLQATLQRATALSVVEDDESPAEGETGC